MTPEYMAPEHGECPASCDVCGESIAAGQHIHTALARAQRWGLGDDEEGEDLHERTVSWCDACDAGLGRRMRRAMTRVHRCGCGCVEAAAERAA